MRNSYYWGMQISAVAGLTNSTAFVEDGLDLSIQTERLQCDSSVWGRTRNELCYYKPNFEGFI